MKTAISMLPDLPPLKREGNIIYFPGAWQDEPPEPPKALEEPMPPFAEYRDTFRKLGITAPHKHEMIYYSLYYHRIRSLEELAKTPPEKIHRRGMGPKTYEMIRNVLESNGITSEIWGIPEAAVTRQEN
jgi:hypothetical protein